MSVTKRKIDNAKNRIGLISTKENLQIYPGEKGKGVFYAVTNEKKADSYSGETLLELESVLGGNNIVKQFNFVLHSFNKEIKENISWIISLVGNKKGLQINWHHGNKEILDKGISLNNKLNLNLNFIEIK
jgi:hypothetical protein